MDKKIIEFNKKTRNSKKMPELRAGDVVRVHMKIKEGGKERTQVFEGLIIAVKAKQSSSPTITVRKVSSGVGVEIIVPIFSPNVEKIEVVKRAKVRRAKLYYIRGLSAKKSRLKYKDFEEFIPEEEVKEIVEEPETAEEIQEGKKGEKDSQEKKETNKDKKKSKEEKSQEKPKEDKKEETKASEKK